MATLPDWGRVAAAACLGAATAMLTPGCKSSTKASDQAAGPLPTYESIAEKHNARVARLGRIWSLATVSMTWIEESGKKRWEQGNGHLQHEAPLKTAVSIGKLGETLFWIGSDDVHYWIIDLQENRRAYIGAHALLTDERARELGLAVSPAELPMLLGIRGIPSADGPFPVRRGEDGLIDIEVPHGTKSIVYSFDARKTMPRRIRVLDAQGRALLTSELRNDDFVKLAGHDAFFPEVATLIDIRNEVDNSSIKITLSQMSDKKINPINFDITQLIETLGVPEVVDLDAAPEPAVSTAAEGATP